MDKSPIITLPNDDVLVARLRLKLAEYKSRFNMRAPALQMDTIFKVLVLETLLEKHEVNTWKLARAWIKANPYLCDRDAFENACGVIKDYAEDGGKNLVDGTGLPELLELLD